MLEAQGFFMRINLDSKLTSYHDLYERFSPSGINNSTSPKGMKYPEWFEFLVPASEVTLELIQNELLNTESSLFQASQEIKEFVQPLFIYRSGRSSEITDYVLGLENLKALRHKKLGGGTYDLGIAYEPSRIQPLLTSRTLNNVFAYVPELEWFDKRVRDMKFEDIVTVFPPAEAEMFKLIIGRACVGRTGNVHPGTNDVVKHGFRKAGIIVGEPGVGKSTVLNGVLKAMQYCGFNVVNFGQFGSRFNQGSVISSHLAYNDDLTLDSLERMLN